MNGDDAVPPDGSVLLEGVVGSTAYGLARPDSDIDTTAVFAYPTLDLLGLDALQESFNPKSPDRQFHEAAKFVRLALKCNPAILELLWLPDELYRVRTMLGDELIAIRSSFLSAPLVRAAYMGYAEAQIGRMMVNAGVPEKRLKNARHVVRLIEQGKALYVTGSLPVRLPDTDYVWYTGEEVARDAATGRRLINEAQWAMGASATPLPNVARREVGLAWLLKVRRELWNGG